MIFQRNLLIAALLLITPPATMPAAAEEDDPDKSEPGVTDYIAMEPAFVTHVGKPGDRIVYLKASVTLRASRETTRTAADAHMPLLRHELVMLFGEQTDAEWLASPEGQQTLRDLALERVNGVLEEQQTGEQVTGILFTEFVVQR